MTKTIPMTVLRTMMGKLGCYEVANDDNDDGVDDDAGKTMMSWGG